MIEIIGISPPQRKDSTYLMADFVELLCLCNPDGEVGLDEAVATVYNSSEYENERELEGEEKPPSEQQITKGADWFKQLSYRQKSLPSSYPFRVLDDEILVQRCDLTDMQNLYIFFLVCTHLNSVGRKHRNIFTSGFEAISAKALEIYLPGFEIHRFGKTADGRQLYANKLYDAIKQLSSNLREKCICDAEGIGEKNTGDGGLDIVAFKHPCEKENVGGCLICLSQCACGPYAWENKQHESGYDRWRKRILFMHRPANFMFTPVFFRNSNGGWFQEDKIDNSIVIDRQRLCFLIKEGEIPGNIDLYTPVEAFYNYR